LQKRDLTEKKKSGGGFIIRPTEGGLQNAERRGGGKKRLSPWRNNCRSGRPGHGKGASWGTFSSVPGRQKKKDFLGEKLSEPSVMQ